MNRLAIVLLAIGGCMGSRPSEPSSESPKTPSAPAVEPERITLQHILISFAGAGTEAKRSKAEAERLAGDVFGRAQKDANFDTLMKELSDDTGGGVYSLFNTGAQKQAADEYPRKGMVPAFGDVGFKLAVGQVGMAPFDPKASPYGWHVIKRLK